MAVVSDAFVRIRPKLDAFAAELRKEVAKAVKSNSPKVRVTPDLTGFRTKLNAEVKKVNATARVAVEPSLVGVQAKVNREARARNLTMPVKVEPNLTGFQTSLSRALRSNNTAVKEAGDRLGRDFSASFNKSARKNADVSGIGGGGSNNNAFRKQENDNNSFRNGLGESLGLLDRFSRSLTRIGLINAFAVAAGGALQLTAALSPVVGILAAIPGAAAVAGSAIASIGLGVSGIGAAISASTQATAAAGAAASSTRTAQRAVEEAIRGVADAQRDVARANEDVEESQRGIIRANRQLDQSYQDVKDALQAQLDATDEITKSQARLNKARKDAKQELEEYRNALRGAALDEEAANLALIEAQDEYDKLLGDGVQNEVKLRKARLDVAQAQLNAEEAAQRSIDLQLENNEAQKKGVAGNEAVIDAQDQLSDAYRNAEEATRSIADANYAVTEALQGVTDANRDLRDAHQSVADAEEGVIEAQQRVIDSQIALQESSAGGAAAVNKFAEAMAKLSPNAQSFVRAILSLQAPFAELRRRVQDNLFAGLDQSILTLANASLPTLNSGLGGIATALNGVATASFEAAASPIFQENLGKIFASTTAIIQKLQPVIEPLTVALSNLAVAALPVVERFADFVTNGLASFSAFANTEEGAKKLADTMDTAADVLSDVFDLAKAVGGVIATIFDAGNESGFLDNLTGIVEKFGEFLKTPEGQEDLANLFQFLTTASQAFFSVISNVADIISTLVNGFNKLPTPVQAFIAKMGAVALVIGPLIGLIVGVVSGIAGFIGVITTIAGVIGAPVAAVAAVVAAIVLAIVGAVVLVVANWDFLKEKTGEAFAAVSGFISSALDFIKNAFLNFTPVGIIIKYWDQIRAATSSAWDSVRNTVSSAWSAVSSAVSNGISSTVSFVSGLPGKITGALGGFGDLLYNKGRDLIQGLINGAGSLLPKLGQYFLEKVPDPLKDAFKKALGINSPSTVFAGYGENIIEGLLLGIDSAAVSIPRVMKGITTDLSINPSDVTASYGGSSVPTNSAYANRIFNITNNIDASSPLSWTDEVRRAERLAAPTGGN